jgi:YfiR/HmsC-like
MCIVAAGLCALPGAGTGAHAQTSEYDVKAAYLLNFGKFIRVAGAPEPQHSTFDICILGRDPIGRVMDDIAANESIDDRPVRVSRIADASQGRKCDILFISSFEGDAIREDLAVLGDANALTVSDAPGFLERGGMIQFVPQGDHVRFEVNLDAVDRTHLVLSSELLRVAAAVKGRPSGVLR